MLRALLCHLPIHKALAIHIWIATHVLKNAVLAYTLQHGIVHTRGGVLEDVLGLEDSSRTHFEVLGLGLEGQVLGIGLEASSPRKLPCPRLDDSTFLELLKFSRSSKNNFWKAFFTGELLRNFFEDLFFLKNTCACVLGPWP